MASVPGTPGWVDLTVDDAERVRDFYARVLPWQAEGHDMGEYEDFVMSTSDGEARAGICFRRGPNTGLPPVWLVYFVVEDLEAATATVEAQGGRVLERRGSGPGAIAVIEDPAGACCALYQSS